SAVWNRAQAMGFNFATMTTGYSLHYARFPNPTPGTNLQDAIDPLRFTIDHIVVPFLGVCFSDLGSVAVGEDGSRFANSLGGPPRNPTFGGTMEIAYSLKSEGHVTVRIYDVAGRVVSTI